MTRTRQYLGRDVRVARKVVDPGGARCLLIEALLDEGSGRWGTFTPLGPVWCEDYATLRRLLLARFEADRVLRALVTRVRR